MTNKSPFFIASCVRSGTTMLREILRQHPHLECPEETHFFRWADPFGTNRYEMIYTQNKIITKQQEMDGFSKDEFMEIYRSSLNRRELMDRYMQKYLKKLGNADARWFDKTPQHLYGLFLIKKAYPAARFIHIHRNPLNVVTSLLKGEVMPRHSMIGAVNYWNESMTLMDAFKMVYADSVLDIRYEAFCLSSEEHILKIFNFIGEDMAGFQFQLDGIHPERNNYLKAMNDEQKAFVLKQCAEFMKVYEYL